MDLYRTLSLGLLEAHPDEAAAVLEALPDETVLGLLAEAPAAHAAEALQRMAPLHAAHLLASAPEKTGKAVLEHLGTDVAANLLRRMEAAARDTLLGGLQDPLGASLRTLLSFLPHTAGALMDPHVLALPGDLTVTEASAYIRKHPANVRYNLYVVDRTQKLAGVLNLHELLLAPPDRPLEKAMRGEVFSVVADADERTVVLHPAWRDFRSLPVVDASGVYLGAIRFRTLRRLERELQEGPDLDGADLTVQALGDLFWTGMAGMLGTVTAAVRPDREERRDAP